MPKIIPPKIITTLPTASKALNALLVNSLKVIRCLLLGYLRFFETK